MLLLTGSTGFLGSRLLATLLAQGFEVVAIKRSTSLDDKIRHLLDHPKLHLIDIDAQDPATIFERFPIDTIVHTATEYGRGATPLFSILNANLVLPLRLAELGMHAGVKCFINTDSFFNKANNSYSNLLNYSLSKKSLLIWLDKLSTELKIINVVLEHMYGPGDSPSKFVENVIREIAIDRRPHLSLTHGHQKRDFVHLDDVVSAYVRLIDHGRTSQFRFETFQVGTGQATQIRDFVSLVKDLSGSPSQLGFGDIPYRSDEIMMSAADTSRLEQLGWHSRIGLREGIGGILEQYGVQTHA